MLRLDDFMAGISETLHATSLRTRDISNEASAPLRALPGYQSRDATCCVGDSMGLRVDARKDTMHMLTGMIALTGRFLFLQKDAYLCLHYKNSQST